MLMRRPLIQSTAPPLEGGEAGFKNVSLLEEDGIAAPTNLVGALSKWGRGEKG
jgi:hypothetical protein